MKEEEFLSQEEIKDFLKVTGRSDKSVQEEYGMNDTKPLTRYVGQFTKEENRILTKEEMENVFGALIDLGFNKDYFNENKVTDAISIAFTVAKGGVGKTILSANFASYLSKMGYDVLVIDADPQSNISDFFGHPFAENGTDTALVDYEKAKIRTAKKLIGVDIFTANSNLYLVYDIMRVKNWDYSANGETFGVKGAWKGEIDFGYKNLLSKVRSDYDFIIIDTPPSGGVLPNSIYNAIDYLIMPTTLDVYSTDGVLEASRIALESGKNRFGKKKTLGVVANNYKANDLTETNYAKIKNTLKDEVLNTKISNSTNINWSASLGDDLSQDGKSKSSQEFYDFVLEILNKLK